MASEKTQPKKVPILLHLLSVAQGDIFLLQQIPSNPHFISNGQTERVHRVNIYHQLGLWMKTKKQFNLTRRYFICCYSMKHCRNFEAILSRNSRTCQPWVDHSWLSFVYTVEVFSKWFTSHSFLYFVTSVHEIWSLIPTTYGLWLWKLIVHWKGQFVLSAWLCSLVWLLKL